MARAPKQRKGLSQIFLQAQWPTQRIVEKLQDWNVQRVLEIGPGAGILTQELVGAGFDLTCVERDGRFVERLRDSYARATQHVPQIIEDDILRFDLANWLKMSGASTAVVGNIPYHISTPILLWALPHMSQISGLIMMVQLEFAQRLAAAPNSKDYGSLSVFAQLRSEVRLEFKVGRSCFYPVPKVDSAVVSIRALRSMHSAKLLDRVEVLTRAAFTQRRKKLRNSIRPFLQDEVEKNCPIDLNRRADTLTPGEFVQLAEYVFPNHR